MCVQFISSFGSSVFTHSIIGVYRIPNRRLVVGNCESIHIWCSNLVTRLVFKEYSKTQILEYQFVRSESIPKSGFIPKSRWFMKYLKISVRSKSIPKSWIIPKSGRCPTCGSYLGLWLLIPVYYNLTNLKPLLRLEAVMQHFFNLKFENQLNTYMKIY